MKLKYTKHVVWIAMGVFLVGFMLDGLSTIIALRTIVGAYESSPFIRNLMENGMLFYWDLAMVSLFFVLPYLGNALIEKYTNDWGLIWQYALIWFCLYVICVGIGHLDAGVHNLEILGWLGRKG